MQPWLEWLIFWFIFLPTLAKTIGIFCISISRGHNNWHLELDTLPKQVEEVGEVGAAALVGEQLVVHDLTHPGVFLFVIGKGIDEWDCKWILPDW